MLGRRGAVLGLAWENKLSPERGVGALPLNSFQRHQISWRATASQSIPSIISPWWL
jgi:hypothetical protein